MASKYGETLTVEHIKAARDMLSLSQEPYITLLYTWELPGLVDRDILTVEDVERLLKGEKVKGMLIYGGKL